MKELDHSTTTSELIREALRLMESEDQLRSVRLEQMRLDIREGLDSGPAKPWSVAELKREGRKRLAAVASGRK